MNGRTASILILSLSGLMMVSLLAAANLLSHADLGINLRARRCDYSALPALLLLAFAGGLMLPIATIFQRWRTPDSELWLNWASPFPMLLIPSIAVALTLPGTLGCAAAQRVSTLEPFGESLVGVSGVALTISCVTLIGVAVGSILQVRASVIVLATNEPRVDLVEQAIEEAELFQSDETQRRFRGVDS